MTKQFCWLSCVLCLLTSPLWSTPITPCSNTSLGNGWTCVSGADEYGGALQNPIALQSVSAGDLLVIALDLSSATAPVTITDSANNTWIQYTPGIQPDEIDANGHGYSIFYVLDANAAPAGDTIHFSAAGSVVDDIGIGQYRYSGGVSLGLEPSIAFTTNAVSGSGPCPCVTQTQTITTDYNGDLILGLANEFSAPATLSAPFIPVDGSSGQCVLGANQPFCFEAATTQTTAGSVSWTWTDQTAQDPYFSVLLAFRNSQAQIATPEPASLPLSLAGLACLILFAPRLRGARRPGAK